ncbi:YfcC family protein [Zooshikella ganghwensis]|uniref:YfcC family protein n=1 Tax=Zooshikella ganghwensis TaxID=202772 RepID=UPI00040D03A4|nr:YfcC family protein [Zooshikella ganghwensis]
MAKFKFPSAYSILFLLIIVVAGLTWLVPAGQYDRVHNEKLDKEVPVAGTYKEVDANPQGVWEIFLAPVDGFYDHDSYEANAIDVALFVLIIGGFLGVVNKTGAIDAGIARTVTGLKGKEILMIPILMLLFAAGGTVYGMAEETIPFYTLLIPVVIAAGYDAVTGVAIILLGAGIGTLGSTINPFATVIASDAAGVKFSVGMMWRLAILGLGWLICVAFVMRYAAKVKKDPSASLVADMAEDNKKHFLHGKDQNQDISLSGSRQLILIVFALTFAVMIYGVSSLDWWMAKISALFIGSSIVVGLIARMGEEEFTSNFVDGARDLLGVALIIGIARGIVVVMNNGMITDTILHASEQALAGLNSIAFINLMYWLEVVLSFLVPSSSGLAVLTMPIMAPLADFAGVGRDLVVTAYQSASGIVNLITPTSAVVMGGLAIGRVSYNRWLKFIWPLLIILTILIMAVLSVAAVLS